MPTPFKGIGTSLQDVQWPYETINRLRTRVCSLRSFMEVLVVLASLAFPSSTHYSFVAMKAETDCEG